MACDFAELPKTQPSRGSVRHGLGSRNHGAGGRRPRGRPRSSTQPEPGSFDVRRSVVDPTAVVRALAAPSRVAILAALANGPLAVGEIAERIERSIGTVSVHVSHLEDAGLVVVRRRGRRHLVRARWRDLRLVFDPAG